MSDSSDEIADIEIPYSKRPEWIDVIPITQDEETNDICRIAYTETFKEVFGYFRAILKLNEKSERALELTKDAALLNPANYTVWHYRRLILFELNTDLSEELDFITNVIRNHPKNYQVWQHRRNVVEKLKDASAEMSFTESILKRDSKNYHAWQYRQWAIKQFALWSRDEIVYVERLIDEDVRNNSAWNQRYFSLAHELSVTPPPPPPPINAHGNGDRDARRSILDREITYTLGKLTTCVDNESAWNYLRALLSQQRHDDQDEFYPKSVVDFCADRLSAQRDDETSPFLLAFVVDYNWSLCKSALKPAVVVVDEKKRAEVEKLVKRSLELLDSLANRIDTIRVNYWNFLSAKWKQEFKQFISN